MTKQQTIPADYGPAERSRHGEVKPELTGKGHAVRMRARDNCELDRLLYQSLITPDYWSAGDSLMRKLHAAKMLGMSVTKMERVAGGDHVSQRQATALLDIADAIRWLDMSCGEQARRLAIQVCMSEVRVEAKEDLNLLRLALSALVHMSDDRRKRLAILDDIFSP